MQLGPTFRACTNPIPCLSPSPSEFKAQLGESKPNRCKLKKTKRLIYASEMESNMELAQIL